jgi:23S rRNA (guanosine2251-2'-O)-methyltransferase
MHTKDFLNKNLIYGKHAAIAALKNNQRLIYEIYISQENLPIVEPYKNLYKIHIISTKEFEVLLPNIKAHQNILLITNKIEHTISALDLNKKFSLIIILDQITDINNIGAILRSAAAFQADAVIITKDHAPKNFSSIYKISSGAAELIPLIQVVNLNNTFTQLKKCGYWIVGLDIHTNNFLGNQPLPEKTALVLGSENKGIRKLVRENCDLLYKIHINAQIDSLNVSNSAAIALYEYHKHYYNIS